MTVNGATRIYAILGDPIAKTRSPEHFNALLAARRIDAVLVPAEVPGARLEPVFEGLKRLRNLDGLILTMPFLAAARSHGHAVTTGREMFEAQAELIADFFGWRRA